MEAYLGERDDLHDFALFLFLYKMFLFQMPDDQMLSEQKNGTSITYPNLTQLNLT